MKRAFEESIERDYRQAGLTSETVQRITEWIQKAEKSNPDCKCTNCSCGKSEEAND
jgi:hypothetical protein